MCNSIVSLLSKQTSIWRRRYNLIKKKKCYNKLAQLDIFKTNYIVTTVGSACFTTTTTKTTTLPNLFKVITVSLFLASTLSNIFYIIPRFHIENHALNMNKKKEVLLLLIKNIKFWNEMKLIKGRREKIRDIYRRRRSFDV